MTTPTRRDTEALTRLREASKVLRSIGWSLLEVRANEGTGFVRVVVESRDHEARQGVQVLLQRSTASGNVVETRSRVVLRDGMYTSMWEVAELLGRRTFPDIARAAQELLGYACDNGPHGALSLANATARRAAIGAFNPALEPHDVSP